MTSAACGSPRYRSLIGRWMARRRSRSIWLAAGVLLGRLRLELEPNERVIPDHPGVVSRFDHVRLARAELGFGAVVVRDVQASRLNDSDMPRLTALGARHRLDAVRPFPAGLKRHPGRRSRSQANDLDACLLRRACLIGRVKRARIDTTHTPAL